MKYITKQNHSAKLFFQIKWLEKMKFGVLICAGKEHLVKGWLAVADYP